VEEKELSLKGEAIERWDSLLAMGINIISFH
jgi:hypothetical protein